MSALALRAASRTSVELEVQLYAGVSVTGSVGSLWAIQYAADLADPTDWRCLDLVQLARSPSLYVDSTVPAREQRFYRAVTGPPNLVWIAPGSFLMGSPTTEVDRGADEGPQTLVTLTQGFFMGKCEVTQGEYLAVKGINPSAFAGDLTLPVEMVSWLDATVYCERLTQREQSAGLLPAGWAYRLPTEAEWEYACRARTTARFSYGDDPGYSQLEKYAWYGNPTGGRPHPVGTKQPNAWGLCDMYGNIWELCQYAISYAGGSVTNPPPTTTPLPRMSRGGSWHSLGPRCRSAVRNPYSDNGGEPWVGFRVVLAPQPL